MIVRLFVCDIRTNVLTCEGDSRREWGNLRAGAKTKNGKKYTGVQIVYFYRLLQVNVISKRELLRQTN